MRACSTNATLANERTNRDLGVDAQLGDLLRRILELDLEDPVDRRLEADVDGLARLDVLLDVVAMDVDLLVLRGADAEADGLALVDADLHDLAAGEERPWVDGRLGC